MTDIAIVTGASKGIGRAIAVEFAKAGVFTVLAARNMEGLKETKRLVKSVGGACMIERTDVSDEDQMKELFDRVSQSPGKLKYVINNAGVAFGGPIRDCPVEEFDQMMNINVKGVYFGCKYAMDKLGDDGVIINMSSRAGKKGFPGLSVYCASKFAVCGLTEAIASEFNGSVFAVCPGPTETGMYRSLFGEGRHSHIDSVEDVARRTVSLCSNPRKYSSGSAITVYRKDV